jgi:hypothetical protein
MNDAESPESSPESPLDQAARDLFDFAVDRTDVKALMAALRPEADISPHAVEYELPLLKIITVGWSLSYFIAHGPYKTQVSETYWNAVRDFSRTLSETLMLSTGKTVDYFTEIKNRLDQYVNAMNANSGAREPAAVIGPEFAGACGNREDVFTVMTGARMFVSASGSG